MYKLMNEGGLYKTGSSLEEKVEDVDKEKLEKGLIYGRACTALAGVGFLIGGCFISGNELHAYIGAGLSLGGICAQFAGLEIEVREREKKKKAKQEGCSCTN